MKEIIEVSGNPYGSGLQIKTSFGSAMGVAIDILQFLDKQQHISVKNTGWKNGFRLEFCESVPIRYSGLEAQLVIDSKLVSITKKSGTFEEFVELINLVKGFVFKRIKSNS